MVVEKVVPGTPDITEGAVEKSAHFGEVSLAVSCTCLVISADERAES